MTLVAATLNENFYEFWSPQVLFLIILKNKPQKIKHKLNHIYTSFFLKYNIKRIYVLHKYLKLKCILDIHNIIF